MTENGRQMSEDIEVGSGKSEGGSNWQMLGERFLQ